MLDFYKLLFQFDRIFNNFWNGPERTSAILYYVSTRSSGLNIADYEIKTSISLENVDDVLPRSIKCSAKIYFFM